MLPFINVYDLGAVGNGRADDTEAFKKALSIAEKTGQTIYLAPGTFRVGELEVPPQVCIKADKTWGFRQPHIGKTVLVQRDEKQNCVLNVTHATGSMLCGFSVYGNDIPGGCSGIRSDVIKEKPEDVMWIDTCRVSNFTGCALDISRAFCISIRHSMLAFCEGDGLRFHGWDAFLNDNFFSFNRGWGFAVKGEGASITFLGNRVEWNTTGGISIPVGSHYQLVGNYIDRSGGPALAIGPADETQPPVHTVACTGNIFYRSGRDTDEPVSQVLLQNCAGISFTSNVICCGSDDRLLGRVTPDYGITVRNLCNSVVSQNTLYVGAVVQCVNDLGGHFNTDVSHNPGVALNSEDLQEKTFLNRSHRRLLDVKERYENWKGGAGQ